eukprot:TRINITY_DN1365_c0_g1_i1.p4 TRINITY_DN1365_c0_g1~~TRINITY_DN1365_c0_g1_i1.p4  ORF type:complete len:134 (+),score=10.02 TRINITY_DN1365_c0_g1_i1:941-1342(+)
MALGQASATRDLGEHGTWLPGAVAGWWEAVLGRDSGDGWARRWVPTWDSGDGRGGGWARRWVPSWDSGDGRGGGWARRWVPSWGFPPRGPSWDVVSDNWSARGWWAQAEGLAEEEEERERRGCRNKLLTMEPK